MNASHRCIQVATDQSLAWVEQPLRAIAVDEVLIQTTAAGINRPDLLQRSGHYPPPPDASPVLGLEVAGTVIATGSAVTHWRVGDRVCALVHGGGYSSQCYAHADLCLPWPTHYSAAEAACLPEALFTVWHNLFQRGQLTAGDNVLIQAGASGIGSSAIQLAVLAGARVFTTAGSDEKCRRCIALGADVALNYHHDDTLESLRRAAQPRGMDVILDVLGGDMTQQHLSLAATNGRIVNIAVLNGASVTLSLARLMLKRLTLTGSTLRAQSVPQKIAIARAIRAQAWHWIDSGAFRPVIDRVFPAQDIEAAHAHMQARAHFGKIAIDLSTL